MKVKTLSIAALLLLTACTTHQNPGVCRGSMVKNCNPTLLFDSNSTRLDNHSKEGLKWVGKKLSKRRNSKITIVGYADKVGEDGASMEISKGRAEAVRNYLSSHGVPKSRMRVAYRGNKFASSDPNKQYLERKVEITFAKKENAWYDDAYKNLNYDYLSKEYGYLFE